MFLNIQLLAKIFTLYEQMVKIAWEQDIERWI